MYKNLNNNNTLNLLHSKGSHKQNKWQPSEWDKIFANKETDKEIISKIYSSWRSISKKQTIKEDIQKVKKHMKGCSISLIIREIQSKLRWGITSVRMTIIKNLQTINAREDAEKREPSYTVGVNWYSHCGETVWRFLKKLKIEEPYDPAIPLLGIYPEKTIIWKDTFTPVFLVSLFTIARTWKQPKQSSTEEWVKEM